MRTLLLTLLTVLALTACSRLTEENYRKLSVGMTYDEVEALFGKPTRCDDLLGLRKCVWGDESRSVTVNFVADKAIVFASNGLR